MYVSKKSLLYLFILLSATLHSQSHAGIPLLGGNGNPTLAPLMQKVTPAVVNIAVSARTSAPNNPLFQDPFFRRFFDLPERIPPRRSVSAGSGVIVDAQRGYVLTNSHVIENADEIRVTLKDQRQFVAELVGRDSGTDIAVLKIKARNLAELALGNSDALQVGDFVIAIGNPFGLGQTVTSGIVSALGRTGLNVEGYEDFIQTDASINPGNSGGALVDLNGQLVGINTAIIGPSGGNVGIGFAVPSNIARSVMEQLVSYGKVQRGQLGIAVQSLTPELAEALGVTSIYGAVVSQVGAGSAAEQADIRPGDVITAVNGRAVKSSGDLRNRIGLIRAGSQVQLTIIRDGRQQNLTARVGDARNRGRSAAATATIPELAGATFSNKPGGGILISSVERGSRAARYGLQPDDVIVAVNRRKVDTVAEILQALTHSSRITMLNIRRGNAELFLVLR